MAEGRRLALWLASSLDFSEERSGRAALVASELASNLAQARAQWRTALPAPQDRQRRRRRHGDPRARQGARDPGAGPVAARRVFDGWHAGARPGGRSSGRPTRSKSIPTPPEPSSPRDCGGRLPPPNASHPHYEVGAVHVAKTGEPVCGDDWAWRLRDSRLDIFVADGLGHGLPAHEAATAATRVFAAGHELRPGRLVEDVHAALRPTRGAAVAALSVDLERRTATYAGLGNIGGVVLHPTGARHSMVSHNGTAGATAARIQEFHYVVPSGAIVVMFSDGLATHWDLGAYPGLATAVRLGDCRCPVPRFQPPARRRDRRRRTRTAPGCRKAVEDFRKAGLAPHPRRSAGGNCL